MTKYHAVMVDETGCEFGVEQVAASKQDAIDQIEEDYPESRIDEILSEDEQSRRQENMYERIERELDDPVGYDSRYDHCAEEGW